MKRWRVRGIGGRKYADRSGRVDIVIVADTEHEAWALANDLRISPSTIEPAGRRKVGCLTLLVIVAGGIGGLIWMVGRL